MASAEAAAAAGSGGVSSPETPDGVEWPRLIFLFLGLALFGLVYFSPAWGDAVDPEGVTYPLSREGKASLALFLLIATWWVFEVVPIGVTSLLVGIMQALFLIRDPRSAFTDFFDPSVFFIFGSLAIGMVFTKTGLTRRMAYSMLVFVGERTSMIYLGCFILTSALTLIMAHTAVAATVFPLLLAIHSLYAEGEKVTRFGKGLFIGMAFVAGAGSIITLLGAARGAVAIGFYREVTGSTVGFFELSWYMLPVGVVMTLLLWVYILMVYRPEKSTIPGLRERAVKLRDSMGSITRNEVLAASIVLAAIVLLGLRSLIPALSFLDKSAIILLTTVLFFVFKVLSTDDLEETPWNIILLFGGAMSLGFCLWETGAAKWLAVQWLVMFESAHWLLFVMGIAFFVLIMTNLIMNVAAIAISLPVALSLAPYVGVASEVVLYASLVPAGMPFLLLVGAAPNAIAHGSGQFSVKEFFVAGIAPSILLLAVLAVFVWLIWPMMGMPVTVPIGG